jgi:hypothetical protein
MRAAETPTARLAALEGRLNGDVVPEPPSGPFADVDVAMVALAAAVETLPFGGQDQRVRARDMLRAIHRELRSLQLKEAN